MSNEIEFYRLQAEAGLSNKQAAELFNVTKRSVEKWRVERPPAPKAVIMVLTSIVSKKAIKLTPVKRQLKESNNGNK